MLAGTAAATIAPAILSAIPAKAEAYGVSQAAAVIPDLKVIQAWQRMMAKHIERVVRPPLIGSADIGGKIVYKTLKLQDDETYKMLMASKPYGA